jgi:hypothetical protein
MTGTENVPEFDPTLHPIGHALAVELGSPLDGEDTTTPASPPAGPDLFGPESQTCGA